MAEYIARDKLWDKFVNEPFYDNADKDEIVLPIIDSFPAADVVPVVHGCWVGTADGYADGEPVWDMWECSECGFDADGATEKPGWNYCPMCGAKMDGGVDDEAD